MDKLVFLLLCWQSHLELGRSVTSGRRGRCREENDAV